MGKPYSPCTAINLEETTLLNPYSTRLSVAIGQLMQVHISFRQVSSSEEASCKVRRGTSELFACISTSESDKSVAFFIA